MYTLSIITSAYKSESYLENYFRNTTELVGFEQYQLILVLNQPSDAEMAIATRHRTRYPENIRLVPVERESIGASTNRGYRMAETDYITYADVDDWKAPDCYARQIATLDEHPDADFTYGDFVVVERQGQTEGKLVRALEFDRVEFTRGSQVGPNHFFRRHLLDRCGYWDEQLRSGGDFDFQVRAAFNCVFKKTPGVLAYYTRYQGSQSASSSALQPTEALVICLRYGIYDKVGDYLDYLPQATRYNLPNLLQFNQWMPLKQFVPDYDQVMRERQSLYRAPRWQSSIRHMIERLPKIGRA